MAKDLIRYDLLVQDALKGVVRKVLSDAARDGLHGDHHFYISFRTDFPSVRLSQRLRDKYPHEMTIVLQHQFWDLAITEQAFEVGLSFSNVPERLLVPFDALTGFFDPSVQFGLKFEIEHTPEEEEAEHRPSPSRPARGAGSEPVELQPKAPVVPAAPKSTVPKLTAKPGDEAPSKAEKATSKAAKTSPPTDKDEDAAANSAEVVSLDAFRKKT